MSAAGVIQRKGRNITLRRFAQGTYEDGYYTEDAAPVDSALRAVVQPMGYKERMALPEGDRSKQWIKLWTVVELKALDADAGTRADRVIIDGKTYEVQGLGDWTLPAEGANLTHYESTAVSVNEKTNTP